MSQAAAPKVSFVSLGCPKALVDSERIITRLRAEGYELARKHDGADLVIVNTCGFLDSAKAESLSAIGDAMAENGKVIVTGCMGAEPEQIEKAYPGVLSITGPQQYESVLEAVHRAAPPAHDPHLDLVPPQGIKLTPRHYAYLKISEGCNNRCTFCIIPKLRGAFRSRSEESIVKEARALAEGGTKELILIAQDTSMWGRDRGHRRGGLAQLLERLHEIDGIEWIRLLYLYPATVDTELIDAMARLPKVCKYMDMPLQHAHPDVLRAMLRPSNGERYLEIIDQFRERIPGITMRSTFIIGFPGETEEHVDYLEAWIGRAELDRVGFFEYSSEEGTPAAELGKPVPARERRKRLIRLREAQRLASERARARRIGTTVRVLVEERRTLRRADEFRTALGESSVWFGRSQGEAPGVDGGVYFTGEARPGDYIEVTLEGHGPFDFFGRAAVREPAAVG
jgi:ribosomal protein S12 methylthiotransferase